VEVEGRKHDISPLIISQRHTQVFAFFSIDRLCFPSPSVKLPHLHFPFETQKSNRTHHHISSLSSPFLHLVGETLAKYNLTSLSSIQIPPIPNLRVSILEFEIGYALALNYSIIRGFPITAAVSIWSGFARATATESRLQIGKKGGSYKGA
ncbi:hypothetical protein AKJ16_DCAP25222, partial [Drosera capensis]